MKTLEHEIRDVLNNKINLYDETLLEELALELYESGDINFDDENEDEYLTEALPLIPIIVGAARLGLSPAGRQFIGGLIKKAPEIAKQIGNAIKSGGNFARNLINRINRSVARARARVKSKRKSPQNRASGRGRGRRFLRRLSSSLNGSSSSEVSSRPSMGGTGGTIEKHGERGGEGTVTTYKESREDIEATPRFTETDREKIDVVPRAENDLDTANRKRFRLENIKKKIIDESLNIRNEFNNFLIEENIELTEEEYDEAFDILFHYFVQDLNENIASNLYQGAEKTLGFVGRRVLAPALYASDAYDKYKKGDTRGAITSGAKAVASVTPIGAAASLAHDAYEARRDIADVAKRGYDYVKERLLSKHKPSNQISKNKRKSSGL